MCFGVLDALYSSPVCSEEGLPEDYYLNIGFLEFLYGHVQAWEWMFWTADPQGEKMKCSIPVRGV